MRVQLCIAGANHLWHQEMGQTVLLS